MKNLARVSRILEVPLESVSNIMLALITVMIFVEVISRYVFGVSHGFLEEFSRWFCVCICYLMIGVIEKNRRHVRVDFLSTRLPERYQTLILVVTDIATLALCGFLCWSGIELAQSYRELGILSTTEIQIPLWIVRLSVPLGAAFLAFFSVEHLIGDICSLSKHAGEID